MSSLVSPYDPRSGPAERGAVHLPQVPYPPPVWGDPPGLREVPRLSLECPGERRREPRWKDKRLALVRAWGVELPAITGDVSLAGTRLGMPRTRLLVTDRVKICIALSQNLLEADGMLTYIHETTWGCLIGVRFTGETATLRNYLSRRYAR